MNATKCYGSYGCFPLSPPWTSEYRPISVFPEDLSKVLKQLIYLINRTEKLFSLHR